MSGKKEFSESNEMLKEACNDLECAIQENPRAFENLEYFDYIAPPSDEDRRYQRYANIGVVAVGVAWLAKVIGLH